MFPLLSKKTLFCEGFKTIYISSSCVQIGKKPQELGKRTGQELKNPFWWKFCIFFRDRGFLRENKGGE